MAIKLTYLGKTKVPISALIIIITFLFAFGTWVRAAFWWVYKTVGTRLIVHSGAYNLWLALNQPSSRIYKSATEETNRLKKRVKEKRMKNAERKLDEEEEMMKEAERKLDEEEDRRERRANVAAAAAAVGVTTQKRTGFAGWRKPRSAKPDEDPEAGCWP